MSTDPATRREKRETIAARRVQFTEGRMWVSTPPGIIVSATREQAQVETPNGVLVALRLRQPEPMVLVYDAVLTLAGPDGVREAVISEAGARAWAEGGQLETNAGPVAIGPQLVAAWDFHAEQFRAHQRGAVLFGVPS